jgi:RNA polymerase sigma factor (sigma-70 family)
MSGISRERALWLSRHVLPHEPALRSWLMAKHVAGLEVDDIVQETYAKLAAIKTVDNIRNPKSYFFQTAYSILITQFRRSRVVSITAMGDMELLPVPSPEPLADRQLEDRDQLREIAAAIASLPRSCREVFLLRRVHGLSQREVARKLGLSENTIEHHMTRSIRLLMDVFGRGGKVNLQSSVEARDKASNRNDTPGNKQKD